MSAGESSTASTSCFSASSAGYSSSTPCSRATDCSRARPAPICPGWPWVTTAARAITLGRVDCFGDPAVDVIGFCSARAVDEVDEELAVPFRPRHSGVYDSDRAPTPLLRGFGNGFEDLSPHLGVADDPLRRLAPVGLELRLDQHERFP